MKAAKTLIIAGTCKSEWKPVEEHGIKGTKLYSSYSVTLFGQTPEHPLCVCFGWFELTTDRGFNELQDVARARFAKYFACDEYNIVSMESLIPINI